MRIVHICVVHQPFDVRIFGRECRTLAEAGHEVHLIAPADESLRRDGVTIHPVRKASPQILSAVKSLLAACRKAVGLKADVYHFHEPLLIPAGIALKLTGAKVVYDVHEDSPAQAKSVGRNKNRPVMGWFLSQTWSILESIAKPVLDAFVCATPAIARKFPKSKTTIIRNLPRIEQSASTDDDKATYQTRANNIIYAGGISVTRGLREMIRSVELLPETLQAKLILLGKFAPAELQKQAEQMPGWKRTQFTGWLDRQGMTKKLAEAKVALVLFSPDPNHVESLPNKLFEYMAAGLPVVASDFPLWRSIIERINCGLCVNPTDPQAIANAIEYLLEHPEEAEAMGRNGQAAVRSKYNWSSQVDKFLALYHRLGER